MFPGQLPNVVGQQGGSTLSHDALTHPLVPVLGPATGRLELTFMYTQYEVLGAMPAKPVPLGVMKPSAQRMCGGSGLLKCIWASELLV